MPVSRCSVPAHGGDASNAVERMQDRHLCRDQAWWQRGDSHRSQDWAPPGGSRRPQLAFCGERPSGDALIKIQHGSRSKAAIRNDSLQPARYSIWNNAVNINGLKHACHAGSGSAPAPPATPHPLRPSPPPPLIPSASHPPPLTPSAPQPCCSLWSPWILPPRCPL